MIKLGVRKNFTASTTLPTWPKFLVTQILTRDLIAVANHLIVTGLMAVWQWFKYGIG